MTDKRLASATLNWTDVTQGDDSPIANYEVSYLAVQFDNNTSADAGPYYPAGWQFEPLVDPTLETYIATGLPPLNQYELELRSVDSVGNRSPLIDTVSTTDMAPGVANTWQVQTVTDPNDLNSDFGYVLRSGDFNNDGKQDFVITAPYQYEANPTPGIVYIMDGVTDPSTVTFAGLTAITLGGTAYDWFGQDAHVADYNGDGIDDLAIGAPDWDGGQGQVVIYFGHTGTGLSATPDVTIFGTTTEASLFGYSVNAADVNGDGIPDLLVGAPGTSGGNGAVYLYLASATTWPANPTPTTEITGELGYGVGARWGTVSIGDINGDDAGDFIVSSPGGGDFNGDAGSGNSYGISGATALANATISVSDPTKVMFTIIGRINGFCDPMNDGYNSSAGMGEIWTFWGCYGSNAIGDVSFTGGALPDLVVASTYYSGFYLYQMGATGPTDAPPALPEYQVADPTGAFWSLINTDLNGDGSQDILVGENGGNQNVYLFLNDGTGLNNPQNNGVGLNAPYSGAIFGTLGSFFGYGLAAGDFQGISKPDFVVSDVFPGGTSMPYVNIYY
jgi:hypothetical protein